MKWHVTTNSASCVSKIAQCLRNLRLLSQQGTRDYDELLEV